MSDDQGGSGPRSTLPLLAGALSALVLGLTCLLYFSGSTRGLEYRVYDLWFRTRGPTDPPPDVVVLAVDDRSIDLLGVESGIPGREHFAALIARLAIEPPEGQEAKAIAFDYWLPEELLPPPDAGEIFASLLELHSAEAARQGGVPLPRNAELFVHLGAIDAELLADLKGDPDVAEFVALLDERGRKIAQRMARVEAANGFPGGLSPNYRRLFFKPGIRRIEKNLQLAMNILDAGAPIALARFISEQGDRAPDPLFIAAGSEGLINAFKDDDGAMRRVPIAGQLTGSAEIVPPLSVSGLLMYAQVPPEQVQLLADPPFIGPHVLPRAEQMAINFFGPAGTVRTIPLYRVLDPAMLDRDAVARDDAAVARGDRPPRQPLLEPGALAGAVIFVGDTTITGQDFVPTPFSVEQSRGVVEALGKESAAAGGGVTETPGVEVHATAFESLRSGSWIRTVGAGGILLALLACTALGLLCYVPRFGIRWAVMSVLLATGLILALDYWLFANQNIYLGVVPLVLVLWLQMISGLTLQGILQARKRAEVTKLFGRYLSPKVVRRMVDGEMSVEMGGQARTLSVLFSDIRGFTKLAESLSASEIAGILQDYFERMIGVVFLHEGTLDKLMGDAVMAFWGAPEDLPDHPVKTCETALDMLESLAALKRDDPRPVMQQLDIGIGINTGEVTVGNLGSHHFVDYTVLGDPVNLGSRLEGQNKGYGTRIIAGEQLVAAVPEGRFVFRELDRIQVKGKSKPVEIFELVCRAGELSEQQQQVHAEFAKGLAAWRTGDFVAAKAAFEAGLAADPEDGPCKAFVQRCDEYIAVPPEGEWDGVYVARTK